MCPNLSPRWPCAPQRGFTLIEALIALLVIAFGVMALAGMQVSLSRNADVSKQRTEAMRLAQERVERLRSFVGITAGAINWNNLPVAAETVSNNTNTTFKTSVALGGTITDTLRQASATVRWLDRAGSTVADAATGTAVDAGGFVFNNEVVISSILAKVDPEKIGLLSNPLPLNAPLKRPKNRNINIPIPAISLGQGQSATQFDANYAVVYSDVTANVVQICNPNLVNATASQINALIGTASCTSITGYIVAGYVESTPTTGPSSGQVPVAVSNALGLNHSAIARNGVLAGQNIRCRFGDAIDQNSNAVIANFKSYLCVVPLSTPFNWGGTIRLGGVPTTANYIVCRYQYTQTDLSSNEKNIQPYVGVNLSIDEQNYLITRSTAGNCPAAMTMTGVSLGVLHQDCRSTNTAANLATNCPASSS